VRVGLRKERASGWKGRARAVVFLISSGVLFPTCGVPCVGPFSASLQGILPLRNFRIVTMLGRGLGLSLTRSLTSDNTRVAHELAGEQRAGTWVHASEEMVHGQIDLPTTYQR
jgi:hypothetical protein